MAYAKDKGSLMYGQTDYKCSECQHRFSYKDNEREIKQHNGQFSHFEIDRPEKCPICGVKFDFID